MKKELIEKFVGQHVKLELTNSYVIDGIIDAVHDDCFEFHTKKKRSIIRFEAVQILSEK